MSAAAAVPACDVSCMMKRTGPSTVEHFRYRDLKALTDHLGGGSRVDSFDPQW